MKKFVVHNLLSLYAYWDWRFFKRNINDVARIQERRLGAILQQLPSSHPNYPLKDISEFEKLPITEYSDWEKYIDVHELQSCNICSNVKRYQPTSGSSSKIKWIPYNSPFLKAIGNTANIWLYDLYQSFPKIKDGSHYWSLSWLPEELRDKLNNDDSVLLGSLKQKLLSFIFPVPSSVSSERTLSLSLKLTAIYLLKTKDLSLISVWSPTFLFSILDILENKKEELIELIDERFKSDNELKNRVNMFERINMKETWPNLELISSWDTSTSQQYAQQLKNIFSHSQFQGKGLWATEGVVTIPFQGSMHLAYTAHYYEFLCLKSKMILKASDLNVGDKLIPIISTQNGLLRYKLNDELIVSGFNGKCPQLTFVGRLATTDLVGEKIDKTIASQIIDVLNGAFIVAIKSPLKKGLPYYALITRGETDASFEDLLLRNFHYKLARELGQLSESKVYSVNDPQKLYVELCTDKGMLLGNIKNEILMSIENDERLSD